MLGNPLPWLAGALDVVTLWEIAAAAVGLGAVLFAFWGVVDGVFDLREVQRDGIVGGPRWVVAAFLLAAHGLSLLGFLGYTHVAVTAAYLPNRADVSSGALIEVAVMRLLYGVFGLASLLMLRLMRLKLRSLRRDQWAPLFGEAARYRQLYHQERARARSLEAEVAMHRSEKHATLSKLGSIEAYAQILQRVLQRHGLTIPLADTFPLEDEEQEAP